MLSRPSLFLYCADALALGTLVGKAGRVEERLALEARGDVALKGKDGRLPGALLADEALAGAGLAVDAASEGRRRMSKSE